MKRLKYVMILCAAFVLHACFYETKEEKAYRMRINDASKNTFKAIVTNSYKKELQDSISKHVNGLFTLEGYENELHIMNVLENPAKDSVYIIAINEAKVNEGVFSGDLVKDSYEPCSYYLVTGILARIDEEGIYFNTKKNNYFEDLDACRKNYDLEYVKKRYHTYIFEALEKTKAFKLDKTNGVLFLRKYYYE